MPRMPTKIARPAPRAFGLALLAGVVTACGGGGGGSGGGDTGTASATSVAPPGAQTVFGEAPLLFVGNCYICEGNNLAAMRATLDDEDVPITMVGRDAIVVAQGTEYTTTVAGVVRESRSTYSAVQARSAVVGQVEWIDLARSRIGVLGQEVQAFGEWGGPTGPLLPAPPGRPITELVVGERVRVFGDDFEGGVIVATGVRAAATGPDRVTGTVTRVESGISRLAIGGLLVDHSTASLEGFPGGEVRAGDRIEVIAASQGVTRPLRAARLVYRDALLSIAAGTRLSATGMAHWRAGTSRLRIGGASLQLDAACTSELAASTRLASVDGRIDAVGRLAPDDSRRPCRLRVTYPSVGLTVTGTLRQDVDVSGRSQLLDIGLQFQAATAWFMPLGVAAAAGALRSGNAVTVGIWPAASPAQGIVAHIAPPERAVAAPAQARLEGWMTRGGDDRVMALGRPIVIDTGTRAGLRDCSVPSAQALTTTPAASFVSQAFGSLAQRWVAAEVVQDGQGVWRAVTIETYTSYYCD